MKHTFIFYPSNRSEVVVHRVGLLVPPAGLLVPTGVNNSRTSIRYRRSSPGTAGPDASRPSWYRAPRSAQCDNPHTPDTAGPDASRPSRCDAARPPWCNVSHPSSRDFSYPCWRDASRPSWCNASYPARRPASVVVAGGFLGLLGGSRLRPSSRSRRRYARMRPSFSRPSWCRRSKE